MPRRPLLKPFALILLSGIALNTALAQLAGQFPLHERQLGDKYIRIDNAAAEVTETSAFGRRLFTWRLLPPEFAALWQQLRIAPPGPKLGKSPLEPRYDSPSAVPRWSSVWDEHIRLRSEAVHAAALSHSSTCPPVDVGLGFPFTSFCVSLEPRILPGLAGVGTPLAVCHGGHMSDPALIASYSVRAWSWRPTFPGFLLGSLTWSTLIGLCTVAVARLRTARRTRRNQCPTCGYSRAGLPPGQPCPECGT